MRQKEKSLEISSFWKQDPCDHFHATIRILMLYETVHHRKHPKEKGNFYLWDEENCIVNSRFLSIHLLKDEQPAITLS